MREKGDFREKIEAMRYIWDEDRDDIIFYGNVYDLNMLHSAITNCIGILNKSTSPREMVLETWLTLDFALRQFLLSGFELTKFCDEDFDLRYLLLPNSFSDLLILFEKTIKYNSKFTLEPEPPAPDNTGGFKSSYEFLSYVKNKHPELYSEIGEVTEEYRREKHWLSIVTDVSLTLDLTPKIERMNLEWRKTASKFGDSWIRKARQLNTARNKAAHSYDVDKIGLAFGLKGDNLTEKVRKKCRFLLNVLLAVKIDKK